MMLNRSIGGNRTSSTSSSNDGSRERRQTAHPYQQPVEEPKQQTPVVRKRGRPRKINRPSYPYQAPPPAQHPNVFGGDFELRPAIPPKKRHTKPKTEAAKVPGATPASGFGAGRSQPDRIPNVKSSRFDVQTIYEKIRMRQKEMMRTKDDPGDGTSAKDSGGRNSDKVWCDQGKQQEEESQSDYDDDDDRIRYVRRRKNEPPREGPIAKLEDQPVLPQPSEPAKIIPNSFGTGIPTSDIFQGSISNSGISRSSIPSRVISDSGTSAGFASEINTKATDTTVPDLKVEPLLGFTNQEDSVVLKPIPQTPPKPIDPEMNSYTDAEKANLVKLLEEVGAWSSRVKAQVEESSSVSPAHLLGHRTHWHKLIGRLEALLDYDEGNQSDEPCQPEKPNKSYMSEAYNSSLLSQFGSEKMSMDLSDYYETLPSDFQQLVPKSAPNLEDMVRIYEEAKMEKPLRDRLATDLVNRTTYWKEERMSFSCITCGHIFKGGGTDMTYALHCRSYHTPNSKRKNPYVFMIMGVTNMLICPVLCGFSATKTIGILEHLVLFHSQKELLPLGINRNYCKSLVTYNHSGEWIKFESPTAEQANPHRKTCTINTSGGHQLEVRKEDKEFWENFGIK